MKKRLLYLIAAVIWGIPGFIIALKGIRAYTTMPGDELWCRLLVLPEILLICVLKY